MNDVVANEPQSAPAGFRLDDIYFILFRRKWIILGFLGAALAAGAFLVLCTDPTYHSEAKLLLRYIQENRSVRALDQESQITSPDSRGENIINSEVEILNSFDLLAEVVDLVGAEKILGEKEGAASKTKATLLLQKSLAVKNPPKSNIIRLYFEHSDPEVAQGVLQHLVASYLKKHFQIHREVGILDDFLSQQTDQIRARLNQTDDDLRDLKAKARVISIEDSRKGYGEQLSKLQQELFAAEAELAERRAAFGELEKLTSTRSEGDAKELGVPEETVTEYKDVSFQLATLKTSERDQLLKFTPEHPAIQRLREQIAHFGQRKKELEAQHPKLAELGSLLPSATSKEPVNLVAESARLKALQAKVDVISKQLDKIRSDAALLDATESSMAQLQRKRVLEEAHFASFTKSLDQARLLENLGPGKIMNISEVQKPSAPLRSRAALKKLLVQILAGGVALGFGIAFALELFLDQSIKRPAEVETRLRLPFFFSLPASGQLRRKALKGPETSAVTVWNGAGALQPHFTALRDRLVHYFEVNGLNHKPKLVAVAGSTNGVGASTVAKGLALSLSEAGDGNILLVDMTTGNGSAHAFSKEKAPLGLSEALKSESREPAQVQDNLYLATADEDDSAGSRILPKRFMHLIPKMKASDYDYIIFDLPPITHTSITPRLAGMMDLVLQVVEAEKTNRELAKRAAAILAESKANVSVVLNKTRTHVPTWLHQEL